MRKIKMNVVKIGKSKEEWGWMGNMGKCELVYKEKRWKSSEGVFISMRFKDEELIEMLRMEDDGGMRVKMISKKYKDRMVIERCSEEDVKNMRKVLRLKIESYDWMREELMGSGERFIYEDVSNRKSGGNNLFWGGYFENGIEMINGKLCGMGEFVGENMLGKLWMELRDELRNEIKLVG